MAYAAVWYLHTKIHFRPKQLYGSQQNMTGIARAQIGEPAITSRGQANILRNTHSWKLTIMQLKVS